MIKINLSTFMGMHKMSQIEVVRRTGIHRNTVRSLYNETVKHIDLASLEKLCELFNCEVGDMLEIDRSKQAAEHASK